MEINGRKIKIAIFHNFMDNIGGAEIVDLIMAKELGADIYTTNINHETIQKMGFDINNIFSIGRVPINPPLKQEFAYWKFRKLNLKDKYDFYIIAGDWAMSAAVHHKPHFWYVYSPIREIWDLNQYTRNNIVPGYAKVFFDLWVKYRQLINKNDIKHVKKIIAISETVQRRLNKFLNRDSDVINPPTFINNYKHEAAGDFWLSVNRLIGYKRVDMQLAAFAKMPNEKLIIVGSYEKAKHFQKYANYIKKIKPANVSILSWITEQEKINLYAKCRGFITTSMEEDYGLGPIEAMASGKPVIAPDEGGYSETVLNHKTGILIKNINAEKIIEAVKIINQDSEKFTNNCLERAQKFDTKIFIEKVKNIIRENI